MKKIKFFIGIIIAIMICLFISPISVYAKTYTVWGTDISLVIDDSEWYVFTRDNLYGHSGIKELNITEDWIYNFMQKNSTYLYAILLDREEMNSGLELLVRKTTTDEIDNLSNCSDNEVMELAETMAKQQSADVYDIYKNDYKFTYLNYEDIGYNIIEYFTVMNGDCYTITVQKIAEFTSLDKSNIKNMIDNISFDIDVPLKELPTVENNKESGFTNEIIASAIKGGIIGGAVGVASLIISVIRKRREN